MAGNNYVIYTDGATSNNGAKGAYGGWAYLIIRNGEIKDEGSGHAVATTNQRMELSAAMNGLKWLFSMYDIDGFDSVELCSDSAYLVNCQRDKWYEKWQNNNWLNSKKEPVANQDLWEELIEFFNNPQIKWTHVKGHADDLFNNRVDKLAVKAKMEELGK